MQMVFTTCESQAPGVVWDYSKSKQKAKQYEQKTSLQVTSPNQNSPLYNLGLGLRWLKSFQHLDFDGLL